MNKCGDCVFLEKEDVEKEDVELMEVAIKAIKRVCKQNHGADCWQCPANGHGKLCHSGEISCCAPHGWWGVELEEEKANE